MSVSSSSKINNPKGAGEADVTEATSVHSAPQRKTVEKDVQKDKTIQILSAISNQPRVKQPGCKNLEASQNVKKAKTVQHLLSDWRTAYTKSKKVILFRFIFVKNMIKLNLFLGNNCWKNKHTHFISTTFMPQGKSEK